MGFLQDYVAKIDEILEKFEEIKTRAADHHYKSNCAKVSGTVVSSTGVALVMGSLWWAPLTAGSSLILGAGNFNILLTVVHETNFKDEKTRFKVVLLCQ